ncbi:DUF4340 domain-containing protein [Pseudoroseomonas wenyumeiae]|uniref:DUF4340 domain-containing protein n=1 Tax=Teichococcus wenyumeiae TaxID=2478470 RepID=A0A3A9JVS8_9PROT|nr:DUF4340 domain-containing protein [Pseudoroseomonas wenyumeiae]RKK04918.1 DUF4340 domain-containing protein [Pseudoroseomonas wenyumeiae]RMI26149.1 DUF4340 domain-containing protein [Pseudoroseomonas wenyumeiae]
MKRRPLLLLGGTAVVAAAAAIVLGPRGPGTPPESSSAPLMFQNLAGRLTGAARIEVRQGGKSVAVAKRDAESWVLPDMQDYPVRPEKVRELLVGLTELRLTERRTNDAAMLDRLGLEDPAAANGSAALLRVLDGKGDPIAELVVGRRRMRTQGGVPESVYVRRPAETQAWLAEGRLPLDADPQLWIDRDLANIARERVLKVEATRLGEPPLVLTRGEGPDGVLTVTTPAQTPPLEEGNVDEVGRAFEFLTLTEVRKEAAAPGQPLGETRFTLTDNLTITASGHQDGETIWIRLAAAGDDEAARLNARWRGWAYRVAEWKAKALLPRLQDMQKAEAPAPAATPAAPAR